MHGVGFLRLAKEIGGLPVVAFLNLWPSNATNDLTGLYSRIYNLAPQGDQSNSCRDKEPNHPDSAGFKQHLAPGT